MAAEWNRGAPWRQGHVVPSEAIGAFGLSTGGSPEECCAVVISHDCDLVNDDLEAEPASRGISQSAQLFFREALSLSHSGSSVACHLSQITSISALLASGTPRYESLRVTPWNRFHTRKRSNS